MLFGEEIAKSIKPGITFQGTVLTAVSPSRTHSGFGGRSHRKYRHPSWIRLFSTKEISFVICNPLRVRDMPQTNPSISNEMRSSGVRIA